MMWHVGGVAGQARAQSLWKTQEQEREQDRNVELTRLEGSPRLWWLVLFTVVQHTKRLESVSCAKQSCGDGWPYAMALYCSR
jgi:hypothetical protein